MSTEFDPTDRGHGSATRRAALKTLGLAAAAGTPMLTSLLASGTAAAQTANDYKALVCVVQFGGNDQSNSVVPRSGAAYTAYQNARPTLAIPQANLIQVTPTGGPDLGFSPNLSGLASLFDQGRCAVLANVGALVEPITRDQWRAGTKRVPRQLFSHSDQFTIWESGVPDGVSQSGWLGRLGDATAGLYNGNSQVSVTMSIAGTSLMMAGNEIVQYQVSPGGVQRVQNLNSLYGSSAAGTAMRELLTQARTNLYEDAFTTICSRAIRNADLVAGAIQSNPLPAGVTFPEKSFLGDQAKMVASLIAARNQLGHKRQIFLISSGGWDVHNTLNDEHPGRLKEFDQAITALYNATVAMGVANNVTIFSASEFGRCLQHNGRGSDHGWGGHHFIVGGAVQGKRVYGTWPTVALNSSDDGGNGALVPTTSLHQYGAALARWFGAPSDKLEAVMPNLGRFGAAPAFFGA